MQTEDIAAWLTAIWDEAQRHAEKDVAMSAKAGEDWHSRVGVNLPYSELATDAEVIGRIQTDLHHPVTSLIGRFKPSTVDSRAKQALVRIGADRQILAEHRSEEIVSLDVGTRGQAFLVCRRCHIGERQVVAPCSTVRLLALPYAERPGYDEAWRP